MKQETVLSENKYARLVKDLQTLIEQGRAKAQTAMNRELMATYWTVGQRIARERLTENSGYGESVMERLAGEIHVDRTTLVRCVLFHQYYPDGVPKDLPLSWSHVRELITVKDDKARTFYETTAIEKKWTRDDLVKAIQADHFGEDPTKGGPTPKKLNRPVGEPFIYRAEVMRVIDGDTLQVRLDLGFEVWKGQKIRLAEVDAPPLKEDGGEEAYAYVRDQMAKATKIVIRTSKEDIHGRYVAHVFYTLDERMEWGRVFREGRWLNQELLDRGLARVF